METMLPSLHGCPAANRADLPTVHDAIEWPPKPASCGAGAGALKRYRAALGELAVSRAAAVAGLVKRLDHAAATRDRRTLSWAEDQLDGFRLLVMAEVGRARSRGASGAFPLDHRAIVSAEQWLAREIDAGSVHDRAAAILCYRVVVAELLSEDLASISATTCFADRPHRTSPAWRLSRRRRHA
jgi:hypothetical protein